MRGKIYDLKMYMCNKWISFLLEDIRSDVRVVTWPFLPAGEVIDPNCTLVTTSGPIYANYYIGNDCWWKCSRINTKHHWKHQSRQNAFGVVISQSRADARLHLVSDCTKLGTVHAFKATYTWCKRFSFHARKTWGSSPTLSNNLL